MAPDTSVSWSSDSKITKYSHTWAVQNFSFCRSDSMVSSKYNPNSTLKWFYRLDPNHPLKGTYRLNVLLELVVETCLNPVQFIVRTMINNTHTEKNCGEKSAKIEQGTVVQCACLTRDAFFNTNTLICEVEVIVVEEYKCANAANMQIAQPPSKLLDNFAHLLEDREFSDVNIVVGEKEFFAHKAILAARSSVFRAMLKSEMVESKENNVTIIDIEPKVFAELLRFIYTDTVEGLPTLAQELLQAADKYDLEKLKAMCEKELCANVPQMPIKMLITADLYRAERLKRATIGFIERNGTVLDSEEWKNLWTTQFELANQTMREILKLRN